MYDSDKVRTDINLMSWYLRHPSGKIDKKVVDEVETFVKNEEATNATKEEGKLECLKLEALLFCMHLCRYFRKRKKYSTLST